MSVYIHRRSENNFVVGPGGQVALAFTPNITEPSLSSATSSSSLPPIETTSAASFASISTGSSSATTPVTTQSPSFASSSVSSSTSSQSITSFPKSSTPPSASPSLTPSSNLTTQNPVAYAGIALSIIVIVALIAAAVAWSIHLRRYRRNAASANGSEESTLEKGEKAPVPATADQDNSIPNPFASAASSSPMLRDSVAFPLPILSRARTVPSRRSTNSALEISTIAGCASPLKVVNFVPGDHSNASSRASTALGYNEEAVGTPRAGITKPRFLSLRGEGLHIPWRESTNESEAVSDFTRAFNAVATSLSNWSSDRNEDTFTSIPERRLRMRSLATTLSASSRYTTANSSMVDLDRAVGLPHAPLNPAPYRKERARSEASVEIRGHDTAQTRPAGIRTVSVVSTEGSIHSSYEV